MQAFVRLQSKAKLSPKCKRFFPALDIFLVVFGLLLAHGHHRARGLPTCTRLKKMQANACVKIGCHAPEMAVLTPFVSSFFCHLRAPEDLSQLLPGQTHPHWLETLGY